MREPLLVGHGGARSRARVIPHLECAVRLTNFCASPYETIRGALNHECYLPDPFYDQRDLLTFLDLFVWRYLGTGKSFHADHLSPCRNSRTRYRLPQIYPPVKDLVWIACG